MIGRGYRLSVGMNQSSCPAFYPSFVWWGPCPNDSSRQAYWRAEQRRKWVMKTVLKIGAAALALSLMASASAFAQTEPAAPPAAGAMDSQSGQSMPAQGAPSAPSGMAASTTMTANTPEGTPPASYPPCTKKGEDRCMQEASASGAHKMKHHMMKSKKSSTETSSSEMSAPATPPAPGQ
jgi:hypothetical protein